MRMISKAMHSDITMMMMSSSVNPALLAVTSLSFFFVLIIVVVVVESFGISVGAEVDVFASTFGDGGGGV